MTRARLHTPNWRQGFARHRHQSAYPDLWDGLLGAWLPALGPTGWTLFDVGGRGQHGILTSMDPATDWVTAGHRRLAMSLEFARGGELVDIPNLAVTAAEGNLWGTWFRSSNAESGGHYLLSRAAIGSTSFVNVYSTDWFRWRDGLHRGRLQDLCAPRPPCRYG